MGKIVPILLIKSLAPKEAILFRAGFSRLIAFCNNNCGWLTSVKKLVLVPA